MALIYADGFDAYSTAADLAGSGRWDLETGMTIEAAGNNWGGQYLRADDDSDFMVRKLDKPLAAAEIRLAFWYRTATGSNSANEIFIFTSSQDASLRWEVGINPTTITLFVSSFDDSAFPGVEASGTTELDDGNWHHVEVYFVSHDTTGRVKIIIDGVTETDVTQDTSNATTASDFSKLDTILINGRNLVSDGLNLDDLVIWDDDGSDFTGELGQHRIETLFPDADGAVNDFTPQTGLDNYAMVDEVAADGDTSYVESSTSTNKDLYGVDNPGTAPVTIHGAVVSAMVRNLDVGFIGFKLKARQSSTEADGSNETVVTTHYRLFQHLFATDPVSASAWTTSDLETAQFGIEVN